MDNLNCKLTAKHFIIQQSEGNNSYGESHWKAGGNKLKERANADETGLEIAGVDMDLRNGRSICTRETFTDSPITSNAKKCILITYDLFGRMLYANTGAVLKEPV